ncbi:MAG: sigma-70 family RNA polymerase sigma factor [Treponema sp.]|jgi:RNA polymerase sigma factor (sigma-70 family)|nr:sigma-70 family RNA polymerase sigma factor [Treponema sp.]
MGGGTERDAAFNGIVKRYYEKILKFCIYALGGNRFSAEDCTQDIFLILYENMGHLKDYDNIGGWLYKTAGNISKQYAASLRKDRGRFAAPLPGISEAGDGESPPDALDTLAAGGRIKSEEEQIAEEKAASRAAAEIKRRLTAKDEQILRLAFREKHPLKEVAARLGISLSAAKSRSSRLRQKVNALVRELLTD